MTLEIHMYSKIGSRQFGGRKANPPSYIRLARRHWARWALWAPLMGYAVAFVGIL